VTVAANPLVRELLIQIPDDVPIHPDGTVCCWKYYRCTGLPVNMSTPASIYYISNTHISIAVENWTHVHVIFLTGNGLRNKALKY
jgi:hypothetical protein